MKTPSVEAQHLIRDITGECNIAQRSIKAGEMAVVYLEIDAVWPAKNRSNKYSGVCDVLVITKDIGIGEIVNRKNSRLATIEEGYEVLMEGREYVTILK